MRPAPPAVAVPPDRLAVSDLDADGAAAGLPAVRPHGSSLGHGAGRRSSLRRVAIFHLATVTPTKDEILSAWVPTQPWAPGADGGLRVIGAFRFDDPEGEVGIETHVVMAGDTLLQVPLTYRDAPLDDVEPITTTEHSVLGTRWVYDGVEDERYVMVLAGVALTGQGEALGWALHEGRWYVAPTAITLGHRGTRAVEPAAVDGLRLHADHGSHVTFRRGRLEVTLHRHLHPATAAAMGLTATWDALPQPVLLASATRVPS